MARTKPQYGYKHGLGWQHTLEEGPYDGLVVRLLDAPDTVTFFDGKLVYQRELWLDDDGRPVVVQAKRAKSHGGDFEATGYRYVWRDTGCVFVRETTLKLDDVLVYGRTDVFERGGRQVTEFVHPHMGQPD